MLPTTLPLFPLPIVLFPGATRPLHIFEPRYRAMLRDCLAGDRVFGLSYAERPHSDTPRPGDVGCSARIETFRHLPDGRSNLVAVGNQRYVLSRLVQAESPYLVGEVEFFHDSDGDAPGLADLAGDVRSRFEEFVHALQKISQQTAEVVTPTDPIALSFHVAAVLEMDAENKVGLFKLTSVTRRLERLKELLDTASVDVAHHAAVQQLAKRNGKAGHLGASGT